MSTLLANKLSFGDVSALLANKLSFGDVSTLLANKLSFGDVSTLLANKLSFGDVSTHLANKLSFGDVSTHLANKLSFGDVSTLLANKLGDTENQVPLWKIKNEEKLIQSITKIKNGMMELTYLAKKHNIEGCLFHTSNLAKVYNLIGRRRQTEITKLCISSGEMAVKYIWENIIQFLDEELKVKERMRLFEKSNPIKVDNSVKKPEQINKTYTSSATPSRLNCAVCGKNDHVITTTRKGNSIINYFAWEKFVKMNPKERFDELKRKNLCYQCLTPVSKARYEGHCFEKYKYPNESHKRFSTGLHILVCDKHKHDVENSNLLEEYKLRYINYSNTFHKDFSKNISISFHVETG